VLYGFAERFSFADLEKIFQTVNFLRAKDIKSSLIGELKKISRTLGVGDQLKIFQFAFEKQIMALSSYFMEQFQKLKLVHHFEEHKLALLQLEDKAFTILLTYLY